MNWKRGPLKVLVFDIENRPLSYLGQDFTTCEITAIAAGWLDKTRIDVWLLGEKSGEQILAGFSKLYSQADVVSGHYIRKHDLPIVNGALMEHGLPGLGPKMVSDTKLDLVKRSGISASQESLAAMLGVAEPKQGMSQAAWREANRLTPQGIEKARKRVVQDVKQSKALRAELVRRGLLGPPKLWVP